MRRRVGRSDKQGAVEPPIGEGGDFSSKLKNFAVVVSIQGNDPKLMPDLSAAVDVGTSAHAAEAASAKAGNGSL